MSDVAAGSDYLVISRGQWNPSLSRETIQSAIDQFYVWIDERVAEGTMRRGQRLGVDGKTVYGGGVITDGPFGETKEVIGGYWFIVAPSLEEAARIASGNPCLECGIALEIRPIDPARGSAFNFTNETPR